MKKPSRKPKLTKTTAPEVMPARTVARESSFREVVALIQRARQRAFQAANTESIDLYWRVGEYISRKITADGWGKNTVVALAEFIRRNESGTRGFSAQNLWRMRQFYETWQGFPKLSPLVRELTWTHNLLILGQCKRPEEREFYLRLCQHERWSKRELERQIRNCLFERAVLSPPKLAPVVRQLHPEAETVFKDTYLLDFLDLPKDHEVVEYTLARSVSPALIAEYQTALPDKQLLRRKLHEFYQLALPRAAAKSRKSTKS